MFESQLLFVAEVLVGVVSLLPFIDLVLFVEKICLMLLVDFLICNI